jgi:hypothetical protein
VLGASIAGFATPFAFGYALHVLRSGISRVLGSAALVVAALEALACLILAAGWLWNRLA